MGFTTKIEKNTTLTESITLRAFEQPEETNSKTMSSSTTPTPTPPPINEDEVVAAVAVSNNDTPQDTPHPPGKIQRTLSISEQATALSTRRLTPPSFLKWLEYPFRVQNNQTHQYLEEATGHSMDVAARGPINQTGSFVGSVMIRMAVKQAGGPNNTVYGIRAITKPLSKT